MNDWFGRKRYYLAFDSKEVSYQVYSHQAFNLVTILWTNGGVFQCNIPAKVLENMNIKYL